MISVTSNYLERIELSMIKKYARFVLNKLLRKSIQNKSKVNIKILGYDEIKEAADLLDLKTYKAWCTYDGLDENGKKKYDYNNSKFNSTMDFIRFLRDENLHNKISRYQ